MQPSRNTRNAPKKDNKPFVAPPESDIDRIVKLLDGMPNLDFEELKRKFCPELVPNVQLPTIRRSNPPKSPKWILDLLMRRCEFSATRRRTEKGLPHAEAAQHMTEAAKFQGGTGEKDKKKQNVNQTTVLLKKLIDCKFLLKK
jgi:hypothetical protein